MNGHLCLERRALLGVIDTDMYPEHFSDDGEHFKDPWVALPQGVVRASTTPVLFTSLSCCQPAQPASPRVDRSTVNGPVIELPIPGLAARVLLGLRICGHLPLAGLATCLLQV